MPIKKRYQFELYVRPTLCFLTYMSIFFLFLTGSCSKIIAGNSSQFTHTGVTLGAYYGESYYSGPQKASILLMRPLLPFGLYLSESVNPWPPSSTRTISILKSNTSMGFISLYISFFAIVLITRRRLDAIYAIVPYSIYTMANILALGIVLPFASGVTLINWDILVFRMTIYGALAAYAAFLTATLMASKGIIALQSDTFEQPV